MFEMGEKGKELLPNDAT